MPRDGSGSVWRWQGAPLATFLQQPLEERVLVPHILEPAAEIIHELAVARENEYTVEVVELAIHAHPTMSEAVAQAALDSLGRVVDM